MRVRVRMWVWARGRGGRWGKRGRGEGKMQVAAANVGPNCCRHVPCCKYSSRAYCAWMALTASEPSCTLSATSSPTFCSIMGRIVFYISKVGAFHQTDCIHRQDVGHSQHSDSDSCTICFPPVDCIETALRVEACSQCRSTCGSRRVAMSAISARIKTSTSSSGELSCVPQHSLAVTSMTSGWPAAECPSKFEAMCWLGRSQFLCRSG